MGYERGMQRREEILAFLDEVVSIGFRAVTMAALARHIGMANNLAHYHVGVLEQEGMVVTYREAMMREDGVRVTQVCVSLAWEYAQQVNAEYAHLAGVVD